MLVDDLLPVYDVSDSVATVVDADVNTTWNALMQVDLIEVVRQRPMLSMLVALRTLPEVVSQILHGEVPAQEPSRMHLHDTTRVSPAEGGWLLLGERPVDEIALGLVGKFWRPAITFANVRAADFLDFAEPGYAKTVYSLSVRSLDERRTLLTGIMRTATTDPDARKWFRRYWTLGVGSGAHMLVNGVLDATREIAEHRHRSSELPKSSGFP